MSTSRFISRRAFIGSAAIIASGMAPEAFARPGVAPIGKEWSSQGVSAGTIVISQSQRKLFLTTGDGSAISYPIAIGKVGKAWLGWSRVNGKFVQPAWSPPAVVKHDNPRLPNLIPGGAPNNPMGARALTLDLSEIAIHGTTSSMRKSIGSAASYGCIRMYNEDVIDLFDRVSVGTPVLAVR
jgi:lipoprotein-anchoring transpeptidase ErfK/SrfK